jgi:hypothetical protein
MTSIVRLRLYNKGQRLGTCSVNFCCRGFDHKTRRWFYHSAPPDAYPGTTGAFTVGESMVPITEYTQSGNGHFLACIPSAQPGEGGGWTPTPFHSIYHHEQSCIVLSSWEGRYTPPISPLPLYVLCGSKTVLTLISPTTKFINIIMAISS